MLARRAAQLEGQPMRDQASEVRMAEFKLRASKAAADLGLTSVEYLRALLDMAHWSVHRELKEVPAPEPEPVKTYPPHGHAYGEGTCPVCGATGVSSAQLWDEEGNPIPNTAPATLPHCVCGMAAWPGRQHWVGCPRHAVP